MSYEDDFDSIFTLSASFAGYDLVLDPFTLGLSTSTVSLVADRQFGVSSVNLTVSFDPSALVVSRVLVADTFGVSINTSSTELSVSRYLTVGTFNVSVSTSNVELLSNRVLDNSPFDISVSTHGLSFGALRLISNDPFSVTLDTVALTFSVAAPNYIYPLASEVRFGVVFGPDGDHQTGTFIGFDQTEIISGRPTIRIGKNVTILR
jgi:hypothetical protein